MLLESVTIKRLKSIPELTIEFDRSKDVTLILGANGIGKTTALQATSLMGHLPTMSILSRQGGKWRLERPLLSNGGSIYGAVDANVSSDEVARVLQGATSAREWFIKYDGTIRGGACRFSLNHPSAGTRTVFYVFIRDDAEPIFDGANSGSDAMSISRMLSAEALHDSDFWRYCTIIIDEKQESRVREVIQAQSACRPTGNKPLSFASLANSHKSAIVHYINTDLNDFGRGFDLRESPKDLYKDFDTFCQRFGIERAGPGADRTLDELNKILATVITYPQSLQGEATIGRVQLAISSLATDEPHTQAPIQVKRVDDTLVPTDFLSSGENEVFFVFLLLLATPEGSIVIMDEPDMHISNFQKRIFFNEILVIAKTRRLRLIISTHSDVALTLKPNVNGIRVLREAKVIRYGATMGAPMESDFKEDFLIESALNHWKVAFVALRNVFAFRGWKTLPKLVASQIDQNSVQAALYLGALGTIISGITSLLLDLILGNQPDHLNILKRSLLLAVTIGGATLLLSYVVGKIQRQHRHPQPYLQDDA